MLTKLDRISLKVLMKWTALAFVAVCFTGCASLHSVSMTSFPENRSNVVKAQVSKVVFLAFNFNNDFVLDLIPELKAQCPKGQVTGITSKYETRWYLIVHKMLVTTEGFCSTAKNVQPKKPKKA